MSAPILVVSLCSLGQKIIRQKFLHLSENIKLNQADSAIRPINLAISGESGVKKLYLDKETNSGKNSFFGEGRSAEVKCMSLNDLFLDLEITDCDLLKIDIEGAEYDVLYNTNDETFSKIKKLILEWHFIPGVDSPLPLKSFLENKGFKTELKNELIIAERIN